MEICGIEEDIKNLKAYIELVIEKNYCDCNELNTICYGKYGDGSKNVAKSIENILTAYEKEKEKNKKIENELEKHIKFCEQEAEGSLNNEICHISLNFNKKMLNILNKEE